MSVAFRLSAGSVAKAVAAGEATSEQVVAHALARIDALEPRVRAWVSIDRNRALAAARAQDDNSVGPGDLVGLPIGIKDIVDVEGFRTFAGSRTRKAIAPAAADADVVSALKRAGGIVLGKTTTTEYATMDPCETVNPWGTRHTPGGSSSGSAAAVAAGMAAAAIGSQTAGSLCRPAAYCGVSAIKPTYGLISTQGIVPLSPSFDTLGVIARTIEDCELVLGTLAVPLSKQQARGVLGIPARNFYADADPEALAQLEAVANAASEHGFRIERIGRPFDPGPVIEDHRLVMAAEAYASLAQVYHDQCDQLGPRIRELLDYGSRLEEPQIQDAGARLAVWRCTTWQNLSGVDAILALPVPASAPAGLLTTGSAGYLIPWTALHGPLTVIPCGLDRFGMPLASMLAAPPHHDVDVIAFGKALQPLVDRLPDHGPGFWRGQ